MDRGGEGARGKGAAADGRAARKAGFLKRQGAEQAKNAKDFGCAFGGLRRLLACLEANPPTVLRLI